MCDALKKSGHMSANEWYIQSVWPVVLNIIIIDKLQITKGLGGVLYCEIKNNSQREVAITYFTRTITGENI